MSEEQNYIKIPKSGVVAVLVALNVYPLYISIIAFFRVPVFARIYAELIEGEPLPHTTQWLLVLYPYLWVVPILSIVIALSLLLMKRVNPLIPVMVAVVTIVMSFCLWTFLVESLFAPVLSIVDKLGT